MELKLANGHKHTAADEDRLSVVVADANPINAQGLAALVSTSTQDLSVVDVATSGEELEEKLATSRPEVAIVDATLPDEGGVSVIRRLSKLFPSTGLLLLTTHRHTFAAAGVLTSGGGGSLPRSCSPAELFSAVRAVALGQVILPAEAVADVIAKPNGHLNDMETRLLRLFVGGATQTELARDLLISESTLKRRFVEVQRKLGARNRMDAVARAARVGLI
jgi:DNA-binding NarL/FixJ family response regulator